VEAARRGRPRGRLARWRDALVCRLAETIAEQRTLWALRTRTSAALRYPAALPVERARAELEKAMAHARRHHLRWLIVDAVLFVSSVVFFFIPGPNLVAYYFAFRFIGHLQSWRGARQAMDAIQWSFEPDSELAELASLVNLPRAERAPRVAAIAARLNLQRLSSFFDRVTVPQGSG
jgi:Mitochondrial K+-H+ exchange-related